MLDKVRWFVAPALVLSFGGSFAGVLGGCGGDKGAQTPENATMVGSYLGIAAVLASDSIEELPQLGASAIETASSKQGEAGVDAITQGAARVGAQDIATARTAFKKMSDGMIDYLKAHPDEQKGLMIVHCTMTFGGKGGAWVQEEGKIMNPYEGAMMLHCGDKIAWDAEVPKSS